MMHAEATTANLRAKRRIFVAIIGRDLIAMLEGPKEVKRKSCRRAREITMQQERGRVNIYSKSFHPRDFLRLTPEPPCMDRETQTNTLQYPPLSNYRLTHLFLFRQLRLRSLHFTPSHYSLLRT